MAVAGFKSQVREGRKQPLIAKIRRIAGKAKVFARPKSFFFSAVLAAGILLSPRDALSQKRHDIVVDGNNILIDSAGTVLIIQQDSSFASAYANYGFSRLEKTLGISNLMPDGRQEYYLLSADAKATLVFYWSGKEQKYVRRFLDGEADSSAVQSARMIEGQGLVLVRKRSISIWKHGKELLYDMSAPVDDYGEFGKCGIEVLGNGLDGGKVKILPEAWQKRDAFVEIDMTDRVARVGEKRRGRDI